MKINNKSLLGLGALFVGLMFSAGVVYAYGEQIGSALDRTIEWTTRILGGAMVAFGIIRTGIKLAAGDEEALKSGSLVVVGGLIIFLAKPILDLIKGWAGI